MQKELIQAIEAKIDDFKRRANDQNPEDVREMAEELRKLYQLVGKRGAEVLEQIEEEPAEKKAAIAEVLLDVPAVSNSARRE